MPYCLSCGKLRDAEYGLCLQCRVDEALRKTVAAHKAAATPRKENENGKSEGRKGR